jgi:hypothetical protein
MSFRYAAPSGGSVTAQFVAATPYPIIDSAKLEVRTRAANAVASMLTGLIGALLGAVAARRAVPFAAASPPADTPCKNDNS